MLYHLENNRKFTTQTTQTGINKGKFKNLRKYGRQNNIQQDLQGHQICLEREY